MRYTVTAATGRGSFIVEADSVRLTDSWAIFVKDNEVEHAFGTRFITQVSLLDEDGNPRMEIYTAGARPYLNLDS